MGKIYQLDSHVADLIAAGEVVERPASAAKELIENSIDAGATAITVEIQRGGVALLRVTDDGCGLSPEDAKTAFLRHATSKIRTAEDLYAITTLGFRGEALAAMSAVSRIDLLTRERGALYGVSLSLEAGTVIEESEAGCPEGTTIVIRDLFFNTPARQKFMKKDNTEALQVQGVVLRAAQSHPEIAFTYLSEGREILRTPGNGQLLACLHSLWGHEVAAGLVEVRTEHQGCVLTGYMGRPTLTRGNREQQHFFVGGRPVRSRTMSAALEEAFRHNAPAGRYPICSLHIAMSESLYDVNVHPAKLEVKFIYERNMFELVYGGVRDVLMEDPRHPVWKPKGGAVAPKAVTIPPQTTQVPTQPDPISPPDSPMEAVTPPSGRVWEAVKRTGIPVSADDLPADELPTNKLQTDNLSEAENKQAAPPVSYAASHGGQLFVEASEAPYRVAPVPQSTIFTEEPEVQTDEQTSETVAQMSETAPQTVKAVQQTALDTGDNFRYIGEALGGYLLVEQDDSLIMIDKHAAHERLLFDRFQAQTGTPMVQTLLVPVVVTLSPGDCAVLSEHVELLDGLGLELSGFGTGSMAVRTVPDGVPPEDMGLLLSELASMLKKQRRTPWDERRDAVLEVMACKAAVKVGKRLSQQEALAVVQWVMQDKNLWHCPHGRPVAVVLSRGDLHRQFGRS